MQLWRLLKTLLSLGTACNPMPLCLCGGPGRARDRALRGMLFWRLELLVYAGEPITDYGVQVAAGSAQLSVSRVHCLVQ